MIRLALLSGILLFTPVFATATPPSLAGELHTNYYIYESPDGISRTELAQFAAFRWMPQSAGNWELFSSGEFRQGNAQTNRQSDFHPIAIYASGKIGSLSTRFGRFVPQRAGDAGGSTDGAELRFALKPLPRGYISLSGGREVYPLYYGTRSSLPERYRATFAVEGKLMNRLNWLIDHTERYHNSENDDRVSRVTLRCNQRNFGWDTRFAFDSNAEALRDITLGAYFKPEPTTTVSLRYTERRMRLYESSLFHRLEYAPTRIAQINLRHDIADWDLSAGLGYARRLRDNGDLDRILLTLANRWGEAGVRWQSGDNMNSIGGWVDVGSNITRFIRWGASVDFDRYDSAWDAEPTETSANSLSLSWDVWPDAVLSGNLEHYRDAGVKSDIRGLMSFKVRFIL